MIECRIASACQIEDRFLGLDGLPALKSLRDYDADDVKWRLSLGFSRAGVPLGVAIVNKTGGALSSMPFGGGSVQIWCITVNLSQLDGYSTWTFGTGPQRHAPPYGYP